MAKNWDIKHGNPDHDFLALMEEAFATENVIDWDPGEIIVGAGGANDARAVLKGVGFVNNDADPRPDDGTVHTIKVYDGDTLVAKATGYAATLDQFGQAFDHLADFGDFIEFLELFFDGPETVTIDGSDDRDVFRVPEDTAHHFYGNGGKDKFVGGEAGDKAIGGDGKDTLKGGTLGDTIKGSKGNDRIFGDQGNDSLTGGKGKDSFIFDRDPGNANHQAGVDAITDFKVGTDIVKLDGTIFTAIGSKLNNSEFFVGSNAQDGDDHIIYKKSTGKLFYDADGDGAGGRVLFAEFDGKPNLSHNDFDVI
ncbi:MAG: hypothetical protein GY798_03680 [Hyphomicrobiales bacterium]|nr:hypothetical protein [Hyphomicrobiales bacterium]